MDDAVMAEVLVGDDDGYMEDLEVKEITTTEKTNCACS